MGRRRQRLQARQGGLDVTISGRRRRSVLKDFEPVLKKADLLEDIGFNRGGWLGIAVPARNNDEMHAREVCHAGGGLRIHGILYGPQRFS